MPQLHRRDSEQQCPLLLEVRYSVDGHQAARAASRRYALARASTHSRRTAVVVPDQAAINHVPGLSEEAKLVYSYMAGVTLRFGSSHSKVGTIARAALAGARASSDVVWSGRSCLLCKVREERSDLI